MIVHIFYKKKLNLSLIFFSRKSRREGGVLSWKSRQERGSCASGNPGERGGGGLKNDPIRRGMWIFSWNNASEENVKVTLEV